MEHVTLFVREQKDYVEFCFEMGHESVEKLQVKISEHSNMAAVVESVCYGLPSQEQEVYEAYFKQLEEPSNSQTLVLMGNFSHTLTWKDNTARHK